ncbi:MAG: AAA family ATPase [Paludibacteraceae bacterium]|nr:AAA family ATPase [Paludibacteraceae bacterium]MBQ2189854.1 AAA family ATPase [Paludibacteraceae bacterium]
MLQDFIIARIKAELPFEPNEEKTGLFEALGAFIVSRDPRKALILCGYAGTGKTSVMSALVRALEGLKQPCVLLAPTGRAAKVLSRYSGAQAYTIHKKIYRQKQLGQESFSLSDNLHRNTLFIVDEASMLSGNHDNATFGSGCLLDDLVRYVYSGQGCSLLLVGDNAQLPPVGSINSPALDADYMAYNYQLRITNYQLSTVARQALDSGILSEATRIREQLDSPDNTGNLSIRDNQKDIIRLKGEEVIETLENSWREVGAEETLIITRSNKLTNLYNNGVRARVLWKEDELSNGDRIMVTKNNYFWAQEYDDLEFIANGDMFEIERLYNCHEIYGFHFARASLRSVDYNWEIETLVWLDTLTTDSPEANYAMQKELFARIAEDYPEIHNRKELVKRIFDSPYYNALQIRFAYAVTCHKAQGGQWRHVYIDQGLTEEWLNELTDVEKYEHMRWLYTAITRATEKIYLLR